MDFDFRVRVDISLLIKLVVVARGNFSIIDLKIASHYFGFRHLFSDNKQKNS
jgi:hypothetical protein